MPFIDTILGIIGLSRKAQSLPLIDATAQSDPFALWIATKKIAADKAFALNTGWTYACVRAIAEGISAIDFRLFSVNKDGDTEEVFEHELLDLLHAVNPHQTGGELKYNTAAHMELAGNAYWFLDGVTSEGGKPTAIYSLNPKNIKVIKADLPEFIKGYEYKVGNKTQTFEPYQVLHFKQPDPNDPYEGIGTVQAILDWINADNYATQVNLNYFKNGARLAGVLESENFTTPEQLDYMKKSFQQLYASAANAYQIAAMPKGTKFTQMSDSPKDMDFSTLQQVMRDKILAGFRVPKTILGSAESETNRATAETANYVFAARTLKPKMQFIVSYLNEFLVPRYGDNLYIDFVDPVPQNRELEITEMIAASGNSPVLSPNELRERYFSEQPVQRGDSLFLPFGLQALGAPEETAKARKPQAKVAGNGKPSTRYARSAKTRKTISSDIAEKMAKALSDIVIKAEEVKKKEWSAMSMDDREILYKEFALRVDSYQKLMANKIRDFNDDQKKEVLKNLPSAVKAKAIDPEDLFAKDTFVAAFIDLATPILIDLYGKEGAAAAELIGAGEIDVLTPEVRKALENSIELLSRKYNETTLNLLKEKLEQGLSEGVSLDEMKGLVAEVYEFSNEVRAEMVAETETFRIANDATRQAWEQTGVVKTLKWYTAEDERVCPFCAPLQGKVVSIEETFFDKGDTVTGEDGSKLDLDYSDIAAPPLHISCRCYINPEEVALAQPHGGEKVGADKK